MADSCPKCGGTDIMGPSYTRQGVVETMRYSCAGCGFVVRIEHPKDHGRGAESFSASRKRRRWKKGKPK